MGKTKKDKSDQKFNKTMPTIMYGQEGRKQDRGEATASANKSKKSKKNQSELMRKREHKMPTENKFELKFNKRRHAVLGQEIRKQEHGKPGVNKSKWIKEKMEALVNKYNQQKKSNRFTDDSSANKKNVHIETRAAEKFKRSRKNIARRFNLEDDDEDEDEEGEKVELTHSGKLLSEIENFNEDKGDESNDEEVERNFRTRMTEEQFGGGRFSQADDSENKFKTHKDRVSEIIFNSILEKNKRRKEKEEQQEIAENLKKEWPTMMHIFKPNLPKAQREEEEKDEIDEKIGKYLQGIKTIPMNRLKTDEEIAKKEEEKKKKMEEEKLARMNPVKKQVDHISADDLNDGFNLDYKKKQVRFADQSESEDDDDDDCDDDNDNDSEGEDEEEDNDGVENEEEDDDDDDSEVENEEENGGGEDVEVENEEEDGEVENKEDENVDEDEEEEDVAVTVIEKLAALKESMFRLKECNFEEMNKLLSQFYELSKKHNRPCARLVLDLLSEQHVNFQIELEKNNSESAPFPKDFGLLFLVHLVGTMYSTSDFVHPVVTPVVLQMSQVLSQSSISSTYDIAYGLLLCSHFYSYVQISRRFFPEVINFLTSVIYLHSEKNISDYKSLASRLKKANILKVSENARSVVPALPLQVAKIFSNEGKKLLKSDEFKVTSLLMALELSKKFLSLYSELPSSAYIFDQLGSAAEAVDAAKYPSVIEDQLKNLLNNLKSTKKQLFYLVRSNCKPKPLPLFTPKFDLKFKGRNRRDNLIEDKRRQIKMKKLQKGLQRNVRKEERVMNEIKHQEQMFKDKVREEKTRKIINDLAAQEGDFKAMLKKKKAKPSAADEPKAKKQKVAKF